MSSVEAGAIPKLSSSYIKLAKAATTKLNSKVEEQGAMAALDIPQDEPSQLELHKTSWVRGKKIDGYSFVAGKIIQSLGEQFDDLDSLRSPEAVNHLKGFYGQLGASILLTSLRRATDAYLTHTKDQPPTPNSCALVMQNSFGVLISPLSVQHDSIGSRLEVLYDLSDRGTDIFRDFAEAVPARYEFTLEKNNYDQKIVLDNWKMAQFDVDRYEELEPTIPRIAKGMCPLESPRTMVDNHKTSLNNLWDIAIETCRITPWMWPKIIQEKIDQAGNNR